ncbi:DUF1140 family protein [Enterococcus faecium]|nr:DUF1140 family protein [Enterococcus faecium]
MILKYFKTDIPIHKLRDLSGTDLEGTSAFGLKKTFEKLSFDCMAIQADSEIWKERDLILPLIAHILVDNSYWKAAANIEFYYNEIQKGFDQMRELDRQTNWSKKLHQDRFKFVERYREILNEYFEED